MKKFNRNYLSFYEWIRLVKPDPTRPQGYGFHGFRHHDGSVDFSQENSDVYQVYVGYQLLGSLHPFAKIAKDISNTFKPYVGLNKITNDFLQPVSGIANIVKGLISIIAGIVIMAGWVVLAPFVLLGCLTDFRRPCTALLKKIVYPASWIIEGAANLIRGAIQFAATPANLIIRMPLRGLLTRIAKWKKKKFLAEKKPSIQRLAVEAYSKLDHINKFNVKAEEEAFIIINDILDKLKFNDERIGFLKFLNEYKENALKNLERLSTESDTCHELRVVEKCILLKREELFKAQECPEGKDQAAISDEILFYNKVLNQIKIELKKLQGKSELNKKATIARQDVAALVYTLHYDKYIKSIDGGFGWQTELNKEQINSQYNTAFTLFSSVSIQENKPNSFITLNEIRDTKTYLENFIPGNIKTLKNEKRFYAIGNFIQIHDRTWLGSPSPALNNIQDEDIVKSLQSQEEIYVFDSFAAAKRYADIHAEIKTESKYALPCLYAPIVEITILHDADLEEKHMPDNYMAEEKGNNYLQLEEYLNKPVNTTTPNNIKCITGYYYDYNRSCTWSNELPTETIPVNHIDFQAQREKKSSCLL